MPGVTPCLHPGQVRRWVSFDQHVVVGSELADAIEAVMLGVRALGCCDSVTGRVL